MKNISDIAVELAEKWEELRHLLPKRFYVWLNGEGSQHQAYSYRQAMFLRVHGYGSIVEWAAAKKNAESVGNHTD